MMSTHRYVPQGMASLASDAPGWSAEAQLNDESGAVDEQTDGRGPVCWKCKGVCTLKLRAQDRKKQKSEQKPFDNVVGSSNKDMHQRPCPVCHGKGYLPVRSRFISALDESKKTGGSITARRRRPKEWFDFGHTPPVVQACESIVSGSTRKSLPYAFSFLAEANGSDTDYSPREDVPITDVPKDTKDIPTWLPINRGEQLCNLVGKWRILQKIGSHRWTTDDIVTAWVAATSLFDAMNVSDMTDIKYLDLGTGNGSVLQMVTWYLLSQGCDIKASGVEARTEAVGLATRSLAFNLERCELYGNVYKGNVIGKSEIKIEPGQYNVKVVNGDFRDLIALSCQQCQSITDDENSELKEIASETYDLITGTPPYFRVDFSTNGSNGTDSKDEIVTAAVINQGGMPTSMQSAPARCEFRGGVEAYCEVASALLSPNGIFVVCENWLNNDRVWSGAKNVGLEMIKVWPVKGKVGKDNLFAVYVMKKSYNEGQRANGEQDIQPTIVVRGGNGKWTNDYANIMATMGIPHTSA